MIERWATRRRLHGLLKGYAFVVACIAETSGCRLLLQFHCRRWLVWPQSSLKVVAMVYTVFIGQVKSLRSGKLGWVDVCREGRVGSKAFAYRVAMCPGGLGAAAVQLVEGWSLNPLLADVCPGK